MEAIEYLRGEENQELNNVIILIVKEFLNISEKEEIDAMQQDFRRLKRKYDYKRAEEH